MPMQLWEGRWVDFENRKIHTADTGRSATSAAAGRGLCNFDGRHLELSGLVKCLLEKGGVLSVAFKVARKDVKLLD